MITCTRRLEFDAAHRVMEHEGQCKHLHGHRYVLEVTFTADTLDALGRVVDFAVIKEKLGGWIDEHWDHNTILYRKDAPLGRSIAEHTQQAIFYLPENPTAENMAAYIFNVVCPDLFGKSGLRCTQVTLHETPNCRAEVA
ncbi:MAG: 6-carboxytetrahydropterin synthase [Alphaproteobacteria bacterium]|nr:6-carboxytetrahydropterin synthase [Alphaproteobacteria bacterium]